MFNYVLSAKIRFSISLVSNITDAGKTPLCNAGTTKNRKDRAETLMQREAGFYMSLRIKMPDRRN